MPFVPSRVRPRPVPSGLDQPRPVATSAVYIRAPLFFVGIDGFRHIDAAQREQSLMT